MPLKQPRSNKEQRNCTSNCRAKLNGNYSNNSKEICPHLIQKK